MSFHSDGNHSLEKIFVKEEKYSVELEFVGKSGDKDKRQVSTVWSDVSVLLTAPLTLS